MWKKIAILVGVLVLCGVGYAAWMMRSQAEEIKADFGPVDPQKLAALTLPGDSGLPDFKLADKTDKTVFIVVGDRESQGTGEQKARNLALNHWLFPDHVEGIIVGDVKGFELFKSKILEIMGMIRPELRYPMYVDFKGDVFETFHLPRGHAGTAVIQNGKVVFRHAGVMEPDKIEELRKLLQASEPPTPDAPDFTLGELTRESCKGKVCLIATLPNPVPLSEIPELEGGFEGDHTQVFEQMKRPEIRVASLVAKIDAELKDASQFGGVLVGETPNVTYKHVKLVSPADVEQTTTGIKIALGLPLDVPTMIIINPEGKVVLAEHGMLPMYKLGRVGELLGIELDGQKHDED